MRVKLDPIAFLVPPFILLIRVVEVHIAGKLFAKAEGSRPLSLVLCPVEFGLNNKMFWAPWIGEVDILQIHGLKAILSTCVIVKKKRYR